MLISRRLAITRHAWFFAVLLSLSQTAPAWAGAWVPVDCKDRIQEIAALRDATPAEVREDWKEHRRLVRKAVPGSSFYAPRPFPQTRDAIIEDFRYVFFEKLFDRGPERLAPEEREIYQGLEAGTVAIDIHRVENWNPSRCSAHRRDPYYHLLRLFDETGREVARATIHETGLLGTYGRVSELAELGFPSLEDTERVIAERFGMDLEVSDAQYVALSGMPFRCKARTPCVAFRSNGKVLVNDRNALLYELGGTADQSSVSDYNERLLAREALLGASETEAPEVTQGFGLVRARLVARDPEMVELQGGPGPGAP